jgi:tol-pal system protein YbgF
MRIQFFLFLLLFLFSCSSSKNVAQEPSKEDDVSSLYEEEAKKESTGDDKLMSLLDSDDTKTVKKPDEENATDLNKAENVEYEAIDGEKIPTETAGTSEKTNAAAKEEAASSKNMQGEDIDALKNEISSLKKNINQKDQKINNLLSEKDRLANENTKLKSTTATPQIVYQNSGETLDADTYKIRYNEAYQLFLSKNYTAAIPMFENLIANNANNSLADNAQYWIGESLFGQRKFKEAALAFEKVFTFTKSNKEEDAQFKLGYCYSLINDKVNARLELNRFINKFPSSRNVPRAQRILDSL